MDKIIIQRSASAQAVLVSTIIRSVQPDNITGNGNDKCNSHDDGECLNCTGPVRTFTITVNPGANISSTNAPIRVCLTDTIVLLTATPTGGEWSGVGISGSTFNAATAGLGVKVVTYTVNNTFGCTGTALVKYYCERCWNVTMYLRAH